MNAEHRIRQLEGEVRDLTRRNRDLQTDIRGLSTRGDDLQQEVAELKIKVRDLEAQVDKLKREITALKLKIEDLEDLKTNFEKYVLTLDWTLEAPPSCLEYLFKTQLTHNESTGLRTRFVGRTIRKVPNGVGTYETEDYIMEGVFVNGQPHGSFVVRDKKRGLQGNVTFRHGTQEGIFDWISAVDGQSFVHRGMSVDNKTEGPSFMMKKNGDLEFSLFEAGMLDGESVTIDSGLQLVTLQKWSMNKKCGQPMIFFRGHLPSFPHSVPQYAASTWPVMDHNPTVPACPEVSEPLNDLQAPLTLQVQFQSVLANAAEAAQDEAAQDEAQLTVTVPEVEAQTSNESQTLEVMTSGMSPNEELPTFDQLDSRVLEEPPKIVSEQVSSTPKNEPVVPRNPPPQREMEEEEEPQLLMN